MPRPCFAPRHHVASRGLRRVLLPPTSIVRAAADALCRHAAQRRRSTCRASASSSATRHGPTVRSFNNTRDAFADRAIVTSALATGSPRLAHAVNNIRHNPGYGTQLTTRLAVAGIAVKLATSTLVVTYGVSGAITTALTPSHDGCTVPVIPCSPICYRRAASTCPSHDDARQGGCVQTKPQIRHGGHGLADLTNSLLRSSSSEGSKLARRHAG